MKYDLKEALYFLGAVVGSLAFLMWLDQKQYMERMSAVTKGVERSNVTPIKKPASED